MEDGLRIAEGAPKAQWRRAGSPPQGRFQFVSDQLARWGQPAHPAQPLADGGLHTGRASRRAGLHERDVSALTEVPWPRRPAVHPGLIFTALYYLRGTDPC